MDFNKPVIFLSGEEFLPKEGVTFAQQVLSFFESQGGQARSPWGPVILDMKGIQSDKSHGIGRIKAASFAAIKDVLEKGSIILPLDYYLTGGKKQIVVIYNLRERRLYLHETFLTEKNPEIAASSLVRSSGAASPQSQGSIAKILLELIKSK